MESTATARDELRDRILIIEQALDAGRYTPGSWNDVLRVARGLPSADRAALADDISRVSRKLHQRHRWRTVRFALAYGAEVVLAVAGLILLIAGLRDYSNLLVIIAAGLWATAFQPLIKAGTGLLLGIGYDYAYLFYIEPRFKLTYGKYLAAPRWARVIFHLAGMIGSPIGLWLTTLWTSGNLIAANYVCWIFFWLIVATNLVPFFALLFGMRKIGRFRLRFIDSSAGMAALELREALEI
jgi:hypothetical protein